jgi:hypothetical protein
MATRRQRRPRAVLDWLELPSDLIVAVVQCIENLLDLLAFSASSFQLLTLVDRNLLRRARDTADRPHALLAYEE